MKPSSETSPIGLDRSAKSDHDHKNDRAVKKFHSLLLSLLSATNLSLISCSGSQSAEDDQDASTSELPEEKVKPVETVPVLEDLPAPQIKVAQSKKIPLFVDPPTHSELMKDEDKKTVFAVSDPPVELPKQEDPSGITATPPLPELPSKPIDLN